VTTNELRAALKALDWSQAELGRQTHYSAQQVGYWLSAKHPIPDWLEGFLDPRVEVKRLAKKLGVAK